MGGRRLCSVPLGFHAVGGSAQRSLWPQARVARRCGAVHLGLGGLCRRTIASCPHRRLGPSGRGRSGGHPRLAVDPHPGLSGSARARPRHRRLVVLQRHRAHRRSDPRRAVGRPCQLAQHLPHQPAFGRFDLGDRLWRIAGKRRSGSGLVRSDRSDIERALPRRIGLCADWRRASGMDGIFNAVGFGRRCRGIAALCHRREPCGAAASAVAPVS